MLRPPVWLGIDGPGKATSGPLNDGTDNLPKMPEGHFGHYRGGGQNVNFRPKMAFLDVSFFDFFLRKKSIFLPKAPSRPRVAP